MSPLDQDSLAMCMAHAVADQATRSGSVPADKIAVGCLLVSPDRRRLSYGYTGAPSGWDDSTLRGMGEEDWDRVCVHAELNALLNAPERPRGWTLYSTKAPCSACCRAIVQAGVTRVVCPDPRGRFKDDQLWGIEIMTRCSVSWRCF